MKNKNKETRENVNTIFSWLVTLWMNSSDLAINRFFVLEIQTFWPHNELYIRPPVLEL